MKRLAILSFFHFFILSFLCAQRIELTDGWTVSPNADGSDAVPAVVPGTTFNSYVVAGHEADPNYGDNIHRVDRNKYDRDFYYTLQLPALKVKEGSHVWLCFDGINRYADITLDGQLLGHLDGFMQRGRYDITGRTGKTLQVRVSIPLKPLANQGAPHYLSSGGWDWMPYVPGLNSGITDKVWLEVRGEGSLIDPWVRTKVPSQTRGEVSITTDVRSDAGEEREYTVRATIEGTDIACEQKVRLSAGETKTVEFTKRYFPQLVINNPRLWWPNGMGEPNLYRLKLELVAADGSVSQEQTIPFGIREYAYDKNDNVFHLRVNGVPCFIKGGNWGMSEYMLRCRGEEYRTKLKLHREMNFNMIRNWLGSTTDDDFYRYCDELGIMVWDDFWLNSTGHLPYDIFAFNLNAVEKIKRLRNHPCIAVWCGNNEGDPEPPLTGWLTEDVKTFDGGDRFFQPRSNADGLSGSGYWGAFDPRYYFTDYPDPSSGGDGKPGWGFRSEIGTAVVPNVESLRRFIPEEDLWPIADEHGRLNNEMWNKHYFGGNAGNALPERYLRTITSYFGAPTSVDDFCRKAQLLNLESNKAMYEGWLDHIWDDASGIMTWMSQSAYPSMVWQTYDYYYDLTGAYYGCRQACEPLHVYWNPVTEEIKVVNTTADAARGLTVEAEVFDLQGKTIPGFTGKATLDVPAQSATTALRLPFNTERRVISTGCKATASSTTHGSPADAFDGDPSTRWAAEKRDNEWLMVDLGERKSIGGIRLNWEAAFGKSYKIQTSDDGVRWTDVWKTDQGSEGLAEAVFPEVEARYVRMLGIELGWWFGYSLWSMDVLSGPEPTEGLSDTHFIRLCLRDADGRLVSENTYWRGQDRQNFQAVNTLKPVKPVVKEISLINHKPSTINHNPSTINHKPLTFTVSLPAKAPNIAFDVRLQALDDAGRQILPAIFSDNYFTLRPGETKTVTLDLDVAPGQNFHVTAEPYNH